jgi:hypothetical protein
VIELHPVVIKTNDPDLQNELMKLNNESTVGYRIAILNFKRDSALNAIFADSCFSFALKKAVERNRPR